MASGGRWCEGAVCKQVLEGRNKRMKEANFEDILNALEFTISYRTGLRHRTAKQFIPAASALLGGVDDALAQYPHAALLAAQQDLLSTIYDQITSFMSSHASAGGGWWSVSVRWHRSRQVAPAQRS